jgi:hypothetical protein
MPIRKRNLSRRASLASNAQAWLDGRECGFFEFKPDDELESLWSEHGDDGSFFWRRHMSLPIPLEALEAFEDAWLGSADDDEYGRNSHFVVKHYDDREKQALWNERGDKTRFRWRLGMIRPEPFSSSPECPIVRN